MVTWFLKGGPVMWAILACSICSLAIFLERFFILRRKKIIPPLFLSTIQDLISKNKISEAQVLCHQHSSPLSHILQVGIENHGKSRDRMKENIEEIGKKEAIQLSKNVGALGTIAHISPLLGLLGTVLGMMKVFQIITEKGVGNAQSLAGGIAEALITTIAGLIVAIPTLVAYRYLNGKVKAFVTEIEGYSLKLMELLVKE